MNRFLTAMISTTLIPCALACGGHSLELDGAPADAYGGNGPANAIVTEGVSTFRVDDERLYWIAYDGTPLRTCFKSDCAGTTMTTASNVWPSSLGVTQQDLFWVLGSSFSTVVTCPKTGCTGAPRVFLQDPNNQQLDLYGHGDYVYWSARYDIYRCPSAGCAATPEVVADGEVASGPLLFRGDYVYWLRTTSDDIGNTFVSARKVHLDGTGPVTTVVEIAQPSPGQSGRGSGTATFALDTENIYWLDGVNHVRACPLTGCGAEPPREIVTTNQLKWSLAVDSAGLYWLQAGFDQSTLQFCAFADCASNTSVPVVEPAVLQFSVGEDAVYWLTSSYPTTIQRDPKPHP